MLDMCILSIAMEQEVRSCPLAENTLWAEWRTADLTGRVGPRLRSALRCAVFDDTFQRERAKRLEKLIDKLEADHAANHQG